MSAVILVLADWIIVNVVRWGEVVYWTGLPVQTVVAGLVICGVQQWLREPRAAGVGARTPNR